MPKRKTIFLRCECGNAIISDRDNELDPPEAVECLTNECDICNAAAGGFGECWYFDSSGREVDADPERWRERTGR